MFGRKKEKPEQKPFQLLVLTTEYIIEGTADADEQFFLPVSDEHWSPIVLRNVQITSVNNEDIPVRKAETFEVHGNTVVALIPLKDASTMAQFESYVYWNEEIKGTFFIGPYLFEGVLMNVGNGRFSRRLRMTGVTIRHASSKSPFREIQSPDVLINTSWFHGREVK